MTRIAITGGTELDATVGPTSGETAEPIRHPGRWVGGLIGAAIPALVAVVAVASGDRPALTLDGLLALDGVAGISIAGMPIGFLVGRALLPFARRGGWRQALGSGLMAGIVAPPLGAIGVLVVAALTDSFSADTEPWVPVAYLVLTPLAIIFGYAAAVVTLPVGIAWGLLVRAVPPTWLERARMPSPIDRLGARHAVLLLGAVLVVVNLVRSAIWPTS